MMIRKLLGLATAAALLTGCATNSSSAAINIYLGVPSLGAVSGTIARNTIGRSGAARSGAGCDSCSGVSISGSGDGFVIADVSGNVITCDPVLTLQVREQGEPVSQTFGNLPAAEHKVTVDNGSPGLTNLHVTVNGRQFVLSGLRDGERRILDVSSAMQPGNGNVIVLTAHGKPGGSAEVAIHD